MRSMSFVDECVAEVIIMHKEGLYDPNCREIAARKYRGKRVPPGLITDVRKNLRQIQSKLRKRGYLVHCTGPNYYLEYPGRESFRDLPPKDDVECQYVSPVGKSEGGKPNYREGLYIAKEKNDLYWQYMNRHHRKSSSISTREGAKRLIEANQAGHVPLRTARKAMKQTINAILPPNIALLGDLSNGDSDSGGLLDGPKKRGPKKT